jgi:hypothetical protein
LTIFEERAKLNWVLHAVILFYTAFFLFICYDCVPVSLFQWYLIVERFLIKNHVLSTQRMASVSNFSITKTRKIYTTFFEMKNV